ncbi:MAG TPA: hypothetical protein VF700_04940 [Segetibacter sp.]
MFYQFCFWLLSKETKEYRGGAPAPHRMNKSNVGHRNSSLINFTTIDAIGRVNSVSYSAKECLYARVVAAKVGSHTADSFGVE